MAFGLGQSSHYSEIKNQTSRDKKGVSSVLSAIKALVKPTQKNKSKAHAVWREHFANCNFLRSLFEIY